MHFILRRRFVVAAVAGVAALAVGGNAMADVIFDNSPPVAGTKRLYRVIANKNSGLNLNVPEASTKPGTQIIQWSGSNFMNGQWEVLPAAGVFVTFRNRWTRQCLDVDSSNEGTPVVQRPCDGNIGQQWFSSGGGGAFYNAFGNRFTGLDMAIAGSSTALGGKLIQVKHSAGAPNALWQTTNTMFEVVD